MKILYFLLLEKGREKLNNNNNLALHVRFFYNGSFGL